MEKAAPIIIPIGSAIPVPASFLIVFASGVRLVPCIFPNIFDTSKRAVALRQPRYNSPRSRRT